MTTQYDRWIARFWVFWMSQTVARIGSAFSGFALVWWVAKTYGTATSLATGTLITMLPSILLGPLIGTLVDRLHRKTVILCANIVYAVAALALFSLSEAGMLTLWHLYVVMFVNALAGQFHYLSVSCRHDIVGASGAVTTYRRDFAIARGCGVGLSSAGRCVVARGDWAQWGVVHRDRDSNDGLCVGIEHPYS